MSDLPSPQENAHARTKVLRLQAEYARLKAVLAADGAVFTLAVENERLKAEVQTLRHQAVHDVSQLGEQSAEIAHLKAENEELHKDYEALADEHTKLIDRNARLKAEVERLRKFNDEALAHIAKEERKSRERLDMAQAEVERLRKAGDAMAVLIAYELRIDEGEELPICVQAWNAAKEGKPSV